MTEPEKSAPACCVVGAGPAGMMLAYLLARAGVSVTLLEAQKDFDRDFRGDAIFPWVLELFDALGLAEGVFQIPHSRVPGYTYETARGPVLVTDYSRLRSKFPFVAVIPQNRLLDFLASEAARFPNFKLEMNASVRELIVEDGVVKGVRFQRQQELHELRAALTVGADGRSSRLRELGGFENRATWRPHFDVLWFRIPRFPDDSTGVNQKTLFGRGFYVSFVDRGDTWQVAYTIAKGTYPQIRAAGLPAFRKTITDLAPHFAARMDEITEWGQIKLLPVEMARVRRWHRPGMLLLGDAAHVMSSIGGVGITCAMQDAVAAAALLTEPLKTGSVPEKVLARVQSKRDWPTRAMQFLQHLVERQYVKRAFRSDGKYRAPLSFRLPGMNWLTAYVTAYGVWPVPLPAPRAETPVRA